MTRDQIDSYKKVDKILWQEWDPIGLNKFKDAPNDEYQSYLPAIFKLKTNNCSVQEIAEQLYKIETETMGLEGNLQQCLTVAKKILALS